jgi:hypothetical protein
VTAWKRGKASGDPQAVIGFFSNEKWSGTQTKAFTDKYHELVNHEGGNEFCSSYASMGNNATARSGKFCLRRLLVVPKLLIAKCNCVYVQKKKNVSGVF